MHTLVFSVYLKCCLGFSMFFTTHEEGCINLNLVTNDAKREIPSETSKRFKRWLYRKLFFILTYPLHTLLDRYIIFWFGVPSVVVLWKFFFKQGCFSFILYSVSPAHSFEWGKIAGKNKTSKRTSSMEQCYVQGVSEHITNRNEFYNHLQPSD